MKDFIAAAKDKVKLYRNDNLDGYDLTTDSELEYKIDHDNKDMYVFEDGTRVIVDEFSITVITK